MKIGVFEDAQQELELFFDDLNWTYIFMFLMVLYGMRHKKEFKWFAELIKKEWWESLNVWIAGFIIGIFFCIFKSMGSELFDSEYVSQILRSWIVVIIFNSIFTKEKIKYDN